MENLSPQKERKLLAILALIFGLIGLILSWIPILNNVGMVFAVIGLVLALIALLRNRKRSKALSLAGLIISVIAVAVVLITQSMYSKAVDHVGKEVNKTIQSSQKKADDSFKWKLADYEAIKVGDSLSGAGGDSYDNFVEKFGKASQSSDSTAGDMTMKTATWDNMGASDYKSVTLTFVKQSDGSFLVSSKNQSGLK